MKTTHETPFAIGNGVTEIPLEKDPTLTKMAIKFATGSAGTVAFRVKLDGGQLETPATISSVTLSANKSIFFDGEASGFGSVEMTATGTGAITGLITRSEP